MRQNIPGMKEENMYRSKISYIVCAVLLTLSLFVNLAGAVSYPELRGFVTDNANLIDPGYEDKITQLAQKIEKETTAEIAVVTIESLEGESIEMYAVKLFEKAGIGKKDKDNGLLILVAKKEREYRFEVGYGLEGTITDSMKVNIGDRIIVPNFRNGEYGKGIYEAMLVIEGLLAGNEEVISKYSMPKRQGVSNNWSAVIFFIFIMLFMFIIIAMIARRGSRGGWTYGGYYHTYPGYIHGGGSGGGMSGGFGGGFGGFGGGSSGGGGFGGGW
jgi:uncharacterized protein